MLLKKMVSARMPADKKVKCKKIYKGNISTNIHLQTLRAYLELDLYWY